MVYRENLTPTGACPRCNEPLDQERDNGLRPCVRCGGVFANNHASARVIKVIDRAMLAFDLEVQIGKERIPDTGVRVGCPDCGRRMERVRIESATCFIDACASHGTWFDAAELSAVMRAFAAARSRGQAGALPAGPQPRPVAGAGGARKYPEPMTFESFLRFLDARLAEATRCKDPDK
jgi:Zn-finger nucleic acid-binding protein